MNARELALDLLDRWSRSRRLADELLDERLAPARLSAPDRALVTELFYGCVRQKLALEFLIGQYAAKPPHAVVRHMLALGLYQLLFMKMPPHAAVNETVALAKQHTTLPESKFVNAVLRRATLAPLAKAPAWVQLSHPKWLYERHGAAWCEWNNQPPPVYVRGEQPWPGVLEPTEFHPLCYRVVNAPTFFAAPGKYYVQDPSTLIAPDLLDPQPGESVLDLCAAPGGKTTYIAQKMQDRGRVVAVDASSTRLGLVGENCRRLGVTIVATLACDGRNASRCLREERFDRVLVDAPCSNTGVLRRRPDLRWRLDPAELPKLAGLQLALLREAARLTKSGGVLVYSTCSLEREENEEVVRKFRAELPGWKLETVRRKLPTKDQMDGAFAARLRHG